MQSYITTALCAVVSDVLTEYYTTEMQDAGGAEAFKL